jgi:hypothetical protein
VFELGRRLNVASRIVLSFYLDEVQPQSLYLNRSHPLEVKHFGSLELLAIFPTACARSFHRQLRRSRRPKTNLARTEHFRLLSAHRFLIQGYRILNLQGTPQSQAIQSQVAPTLQQRSPAVKDETLVATPAADHLSKRKRSESSE